MHSFEDGQKRVCQDPLEKLIGDDIVRHITDNDEVTWNHLWMQNSECADTEETYHQNEKQ